MQHGIEGASGAQGREGPHRGRRHGHHHSHHHHEHHGHRHGCRHHHDEAREHRRGGRHGGRGGRIFDHGELRLLALAMLAEAPRHGYELIKAIEERMGGSYSPSPGVIYPLLSWLEDMGFATVEAEAGPRKRYALTPEGEAFLAGNRVAAEALFARIGGATPRGREGVPDPVIRAMENLKLALRLKLRSGPVEADVAEKIAAALDAAAQAIEKA
ncbi:PadR family transcriptional regulator [Roseomonas sp. 18066]|uniref:PadR family transcriptional regulator n=1 Tax=Roseomonas sp. 18066 TaxID=2681412 RepID=UPI001358B221|nr:PadR family transcriptional regulator [Roseomonas sp. 18066]